MIIDYKLSTCTYSFCILPTGLLLISEPSLGHFQAFIQIVAGFGFALAVIEKINSVLREFMIHKEDYTMMQKIEDAEHELEKFFPESPTDAFVESEEYKVLEKKKMKLESLKEAIKSRATNIIHNTSYVFFLMGFYGCMLLFLVGYEDLIRSHPIYKNCFLAFNLCYLVLSFIYYLKNEEPFSQSWKVFLTYLFVVMPFFSYAFHWGCNNYGALQGVPISWSIYTSFICILLPFLLLLLSYSRLSRGSRKLIKAIEEVN